MDLKETIKQQGTQASALLPELQEYVDSKVEELKGGVVKLSAKGFQGGTPETATVMELKGYQNILAIWDKFEKGEIRQEEISATLEIKVGNTGIYKAHKIEVRLASDGAKHFNAYFFSMDLSIGGKKIGELRISNYTFSVAHINRTTLKFATLDGEEFNVTGEFTD